MSVCDTPKSVNARRRVSSKMNDKETQKEIKEINFINEETVDSLLMAFINRERFIYHAKMIFDYLKNCLCLRNLKKLRHLKRFKEHFYFKKSEEKL